MREWTVANIVDQSCREQRSTSTIEVLIIVTRLDMLECLLHQVQHPKTVRQTIMVGTGVREVAYTKLMNPPQSLDFGTIKKFNKLAITLAVNADIVVERIPEEFGRHTRSHMDTQIASGNHLVCQLLGVANRLRFLEGTRFLHGGRPIKSTTTEEDDG